MSGIEQLEAQLAAGTPVVLDGGFGQQVTERGGITTMPLWATHELINPDSGIVNAIHLAYAEIDGIGGFATGTFRAQAETFADHQARAARGEDGLQPIEAWGTRDPTKLSYHAIQIAGQLAIAAREKSGKSGLVIAGSVGPIKDCYTPEATPSDKELIEAHLRYIAALKDSGVDYVSIETIPTVREALAAAKAAKELGIPFSVSWWGAKGGSIGYDETLGQGVRALEKAGLNPLHVGFNCVPTTIADQSIKELRNNTELPIAVSANGDGDPTQPNTWEYTHQHDKHYAEAAKRWVDAGALLVGGCCGTTPATIRGVAEALGQAA